MAAFATINKLPLGGASTPVTGVGDEAARISPISGLAARAATVACSCSCEAAVWTTRGATTRLRRSRAGVSATEPRRRARLVAGASA